MYFLFKYNGVCFCRLYKILFSLVHQSCLPKSIVFNAQKYSKCIKDKKKN